jgi:poly(3-hydroxybutyrate) depolymerase
MAGRISMGARREVVSAVTERYRSEKGRILDELCATTGWHRKHAVRALRQHETVTSYEVGSPRERRGRYDATTKDALTALWEASDRVCGKRQAAQGDDPGLAAGT